MEKICLNNITKNHRELLLNTCKMIPVLENTTDRKGIGLSLRQTCWGGRGGREYRGKFLTPIQHNTSDQLNLRLLSTTYKLSPQHGDHKLKIHEFVLINFPRKKKICNLYINILTAGRIGDAKSFPRVLSFVPSQGLLVWRFVCQKFLLVFFCYNYKLVCTVSWSVLPRPDNCD